jgi:nucleoside-diphosphate-sugar epimerase
MKEARCMGMKGIPPNGGHLLVTGASGFLGRQVVLRARAQGLRVTALTRADADQRDPVALSAVIARAAPDFAIDAAGVIPGPRHPDPAENGALTGGWLQALDRVPEPLRLVLAGSSAVYGDGAQRDRATRETDPMRPTNAYGRAKLTALDMGVAAFQRRGHDVQTGIVFNLMGQGQLPHMVPRVFIDLGLATTTGRIEIAHGSDVRDFMAISDAADALIAMARYGKAGAVLNIATGRPTSITEMLDLVSRIIGVTWNSLAHSEGPRASHVCYGDPTSLKRTTSWQPRFDLEAALRQVVDASIAWKRVSHDQSHTGDT